MWRHVCDLSQQSHVRDLSQLSDLSFVSDLSLVLDFHVRCDTSRYVDVTSLPLKSLVGPSMTGVKLLPWFESGVTDPKSPFLIVK